MRKFLILLLYRILPAAAFPLLLLYVVWRCLRDPRYFRRITERFGFLPSLYQRTVPDSIWLHAVSVGEVLSSIGLISRLRKALPGAPIYVSCTTLAGREVADARLQGVVDGIFFAPIDYISVVRRVLRRLRPAIVIVLETEIWPNLYRESKCAGCALVVVNGRISPKTLPRYRRLAWFFRTVLDLPDTILVQSAADRDRYIEAGAPPDRVLAAGNLKYDFDPKATTLPPPVLDWLHSSSGPLWIAASTVAPEYDNDVDEDDCVIAAYLEVRGTIPDLRLLLVPRKPERFEVAAEKFRHAGIAFDRRSQLPGTGAGVLLLDSLGELGSMFGAADVVFMGGTLADRGGHNILEPASAARAVIVGPHLENFAQIQQDFRAGRGFREIGGPKELAGAVHELLADPVARQALGKRAYDVAESERGATDRAILAVVNAREQAVPRSVSYGALKPLFWVLSGLWIAGGAVKRRLRSCGRLASPVISIGGLAMGGSGKTPVVRELSRQMRDAGLNVAVLTRGYRRRSPEPLSVFERGATAAVEVTGDEAQTILRDGTAHLGISADRFAAGSRIQERFSPDVFLLDDGFQHTGLHKDIEVVVLDGLDPFAGGFLFPRGRLREPVSALARAHAVVITRAEGRRFDGLHRMVRSANPGIRIFHSWIEPQCWINVQTGERFALDAFAESPAGAFCGLANPESFHRTLAFLGCKLAFFERFPDHHCYTGQDLRRLPVAALLLTTEKDAVKLRGISLDAPVYWLALKIRIEPADGGSELLPFLQIERKVTKS